MGSPKYCNLLCILFSVLLVTSLAIPEENIITRAKRNPQMPDIPPPPSMPNGFPFPLGSLHRAARQAPPDGPPPPPTMGTQAAFSHRLTRQAPPENPPPPAFHRTARQAPPDEPPPPALETSAGSLYRIARQAPPDVPPPPALTASNTNFKHQQIQGNRQMRSIPNAGLNAKEIDGFKSMSQLNLRAKREARGTGGRLSSRTG